MQSETFDGDDYQYHLIDRGTGVEVYVNETDTPEVTSYDMRFEYEIATKTEVVRKFRVQSDLYFSVFYAGDRTEVDFKRYWSVYTFPKAPLELEPLLRATAMWLYYEHPFSISHQEVSDYFEDTELTSRFSFEKVSEDLA